MGDSFWFLAEGAAEGGEKGFQRDFSTACSGKHNQPIRERDAGRN